MPATASAIQHTAQSGVSLAAVRCAARAAQSTYTMNSAAKTGIPTSEYESGNITPRR